ncbi:membrane protein DedA, SNARE-associated domain [Desulfotomaculum arcticum]|uniref:Membrane protein DedA, SNARE-associated domain n=1 Tax=Desulfotruncus arcticus DSM 17038 TaxID=1121424 RepID=A0A1I2QGR3_9FIRM|nr:DedA family protein [Desulfotruncus arcticus]SFG27592.1 membrane protein DedA, SNARE-associated domain [Desulfotomaculum arcticum] [Desulfotruncus arcticus DSM 17038]
MDYKDSAIELVDLYGYWALFITMLVDTIGIPMPSKTMLVLSGYFVTLGIFDLQQIFIVALAGTLGGFAIGYTIGNKLGVPFIHKYGKYIFLTPEKISRLEKWFMSFGNYAIIIGYFLPIARSVMPYLLGVCKMPFIKVIIFAAIGATSWIISLILFGYIVSKNREIIWTFLVQYYPYLIAGGLALTLAPIYIKKRGRKPKNEQLDSE